MPRPVELPDIEPFPVRNESDFYGASYLAALYCGIEFPTKPSRGIWMHGWAPEYWAVHPHLIISSTNPATQNDYFWVAKKCEEVYLKQNGYRHAKAIGLPIIYLPQKEFPRRPDSLLVLPPHSLDYTTHHHWRFEEYAQQIDQIRHDFSEVLVCIHPSCVRKGYWIQDFQKLGFKIVEGVHGNDRNDFFRLQALMSSYEYFTTPGFGSHIAYAAYFGAKVSIFGSWAEYRAEDLRNDPTYLRHPEILETVIRLSSKQTVYKHYPEFFCHPKEAKQKIEWARYELGLENKVSPHEMIDLFEWRLHDRVMYRRKEKRSKVIRMIRSRLGSIKHRLRAEVKKALTRHQFFFDWNSVRLPTRRRAFKAVRDQ